jgi:hypothetical protein
LDSWHGRNSYRLTAAEHRVLRRIVEPIHQATAGWYDCRGTAPRNYLLRQMLRRRVPFWEWDDSTWLDLVGPNGAAYRDLHFPLIALANTLCGQRHLHASARTQQLRLLAKLAFGTEAVTAAIDEVHETLGAWDTSRNIADGAIAAATADILLTQGSASLREVTDDLIARLAGEYVPGSVRRKSIFKVSRVLAHWGVLSAPLTNNHHRLGNRPTTLADVPPAWLDWAQRWRKLARQEPSTVRVMFSIILIAGRWAAEKHPDATTPDQWTRDIAAEYVADTMSARVGDWAGHNRNKTRFGRPLGASGIANRIDALRGFFCDLIEWEWIKPRFEPRRVLSAPLSVRAQIGPNPRIIDDAHGPSSWPPD